MPMLSKRNVLLIAFGLVATLGTWSCAKKSTKSTVIPAVAATVEETTEEEEAPAENLAIELRLVTAGSAKTSGLALAEQDMYTGQASPSELISLKYLITNISICQNVDLTGSGYSSPSGCIALYENNKYVNMYNTFDRAEAEKPQYDEDYIDLMKGLSFNATIKKSDVGKYKYALVNWMKPIKFTAQVTVNDGSETVLYSHRGTYSSYTDQNGYEHLQTFTQDMTVGPAEEAVVMLNNGGSVFSFANPFAITEADIAAKTPFVIDMVFNPDGLVKGYSSTNSASASGRSLIETTSTTDSSDYMTGRGLDVPYLTLVPLVHKASESIVKETYLVNFNAGLTGTTTEAGVTVSPLPAYGAFDVRIELYYINDGSAFSQDTPIYGASACTLFRHELIANPSGGGGGGEPGGIFSFGQNATTKAYSLYGWQGATDAGTIFSGLRRLATVGDTGSGVETHMSVAYTGSYNSSTNSYHRIGFSLPYTLAARATIDSLKTAKVSALEQARLDREAQATLDLNNTTWVSTCFADDDSGYYHKVTLEFSASGLYKSSDINYTDAACATMHHKDWFGARPTLGGTVSTGGPNKMTLNVLSMTRMPLSSTAAATLNAASSCGYTTWVADTALDTYAETCDGVENPDRYDLRYYVVKRDNNTLKLWGAASSGEDGLTADTRITALSTVVFTKQ